MMLGVCREKRRTTASDPVLLRVYRYSCTDNQCAIVDDLDVADTVGCEVFCHTDADGDGIISLAEKEAAVLACTEGDRS